VESHQLKSQISGWNVQQKWISLGTSGKHLYICIVLSHSLQLYIGGQVTQCTTKMDITAWVLV